MLKIEQLNLNLPFELQNDAGKIAKHVAEHLAQLDHAGIKDRTFLTLPVLHVNYGADSNTVADLIANSIYKNIRGA